MHRARPLAAGSSSAGTSARSRAPEAVELFHAAPGGVRTIKPSSQNARWDSSTTPGKAASGSTHAYTADGGLAMLYGNLAPDGAW